MRKSLYICNAKQLKRANIHTNTAYCVSSCFLRLLGELFGDNTKGVRTLFANINA